jgi:hypothetical protein
LGHLCYGSQVSNKYWVIGKSYITSQFKLKSGELIVPQVIRQIKPADLRLFSHSHLYKEDEIKPFKYKLWPEDMTLIYIPYKKKVYFILIYIDKDLVVNIFMVV